MKLTYLVNDSRLRTPRSQLRKNQTDVERLLWYRLRNKQLQGVKFFRQYSIGHYIIDFYSPKRRLAIEVDGGQHNEENTQRYDLQRTEYLKHQGVKVIRFWNNEVINNIGGVLEVIAANIRNPS